MARKAGRQPFFYDARRRVGFGTRTTGARAGRCDFLVHDVVRTPVGEEVEHAQQYFRGLRVYGGSRTTVRSPRGSTVTGGGYHVPGETPVRPTIAVTEAFGAFADLLRRKRVVPARSRFRVTRVVEDASQVQWPVFLDVATHLAEPVRAHLEICPTSDTTASLVWVLTCAVRMRANRRKLHAIVTATGRRPRVLTVAQVNACAFDANWVPCPGVPAERASWPQPPLATPDGTPGLPSAWLSQAPWADGPNVVCMRVNPRRVLEFDNAAVDNAFVWANFMHDLCAAFGFDDQSWAFEGPDRLCLFRLDDKDRAAGDFDNYADGASPQMRLYASPHGGAHAAADPSIVIHEYLHGVCSRLVGGAAVSEPFTTREAQGVVEGICDYFALTVLNRVSRARTGTGTVTRIGGLFHPATGLRDYATVTGAMPKKLPKDIYQTGAIWCAAILDGRRAIAAMYGEDAADRFVWLALIGMLRRLHATSQPSDDHVTLAACRRALHDAGLVVEHATPALSGATALLMAAMTTRNV